MRSRVAEPVDPGSISLAWDCAGPASLGCFPFFQVSEPSLCHHLSSRVKLVWGCTVTTVRDRANTLYAPEAEPKPEPAEAGRSYPALPVGNANEPSPPTPAAFTGEVLAPALCLRKAIECSSCDRSYRPQALVLR